MGVTAAARWLWAPSRTVVCRLALASVAVNVLIVVTGGAVRLSSSGLGCPTWPRCSSGSFVPHRALGIHGAIEFSNRLLTFLLALVAVATVAAVWRHRPASWPARILALVLLLGIPAQAVIGGISVLTDLNPWVVSGHLLVSMALIGVAVALVVQLRQESGRVRADVGRGPATLVRLTFVVAWLVFYAGTVVTGSGPHAGDVNAPRTGLDPAAMSQLHADLVFLLIGLTVGTVLSLRAVGAPADARRAAGWLLGLELAQGVVGFTQYFTGLPSLLVGVHLLGAGAISACATWLLVRAGLPMSVPGRVLPRQHGIKRHESEQQRQVEVGGVEQPQRLQR